MTNLGKVILSTVYIIAVLISYKPLGQLLDKEYAFDQHIQAQYK